jgi:hypothetical protein
MKRSHYTLLVVTLLTSCSGGYTDLDRYGLKGEVSTLEEHQFKAEYRDGSWVAGTPSYYGHRIVNFSRDGFYLESIALLGSGDTVGFTRSRRENGEMVEELFCSALNGRTSRTIYDRASEEQVNFEVWQGEKLYFEGANFYDSKGRIEKQVTVENDREVVNYFVYEKGLLAENYQEEISGARINTQHYEYKAFDEEGNWTVRLVYPGEDKIVPKVVITRAYSYY